MKKKRQNKLIPYNPGLREFAKELRNNSTLSEVLLWKEIKGKALGVEFHRQVPLRSFIVDFYCHELQLAIEVDGAIHEYQYQYDLQRQGILEEDGVSFLRFTNHQVKKRMFEVVRTIETRVNELKEAYEEE